MGLKDLVKRVVPRPILSRALVAYHFLLSTLSAAYFRYPANKLVVIGVTGTKGKSTTVEMVNAILEEAGFRTAVASTIRFKIDEVSRPNLFKMTMPGRGFLQGFLREAVDANCTHAIIEVTSEGTKQFRHLALSMNALIFTNIAPEHIESHGSYENYKRAKLAIGEALVTSRKRPRIIVANPNDELGKKFLELQVERRLPFSFEESSFTLKENSVAFTFRGASCEIPLPGEFIALNALSAATLASELGVEPSTISHALKKLDRIPGRVESIRAGQNFHAIVDYAHTPDSLKALYAAFPMRKICVLGNTGGGRDTWKRPEMGAIADSACAEVILTDEDPYDEDPRQIVEMMAKGMSRAPAIIMERREAIREALKRARSGDAVLITGKGTDPYIMGKNGTKIPWNDAEVVREELNSLLTHNHNH